MFVSIIYNDLFQVNKKINFWQLNVENVLQLDKKAMFEVRTLQNLL